MLQNFVDLMPEGGKSKSNVKQTDTLLELGTVAISSVH